ncbi:mucin-5AC-like isoform X1 [Biomphalaria glabrata]|uniref:Mucin-5AC-like isoform X1 n=2 Tax=Biomphalaria glabrata TaxID=6526 RepID=A0A9W3BA29_BIOGL|nr:mucin-5AC-like isoform X1 [Biomphalaria glabrata]
MTRRILVSLTETETYETFMMTQTKPDFTGELNNLLTHVKEEIEEIEETDLLARSCDDQDFVISRIKNEMIDDNSDLYTQQLENFYIEKSSKLNLGHEENTKETEATNFKDRSKPCCLVSRLLAMSMKISNNLPIIMPNFIPSSHTLASEVSVSQLEAIEKEKEITSELNVLIDIIQDQIVGNHSNETVLDSEIPSEHEFDMMLRYQNKLSRSGHVTKKQKAEIVSRYGSMSKKQNLDSEFIKNIISIMHDYAMKLSSRKQAITASRAESLKPYVGENTLLSPNSGTKTHPESPQPPSIAISTSSESSFVSHSSESNSFFTESAISTLTEHDYKILPASLTSTILQIGHSPTTVKKRGRPRKSATSTSAEQDSIKHPASVTSTILQRECTPTTVNKRGNSQKSAISTSAEQDSIKLPASVTSTILQRECTPTTVNKRGNSQKSAISTSAEQDSIKHPASVTSTILQRECTPTTVNKRGNSQKSAISTSAEQDSIKHPASVTSTILQRECTPTTVNKRGNSQKSAISTSAEQDSIKHPASVTSTILQRECTPTTVNKRGNSQKSAISTSAEQDSIKHPASVTSTILQRECTPTTVNKRGNSQKSAISTSAEQDSIKHPASVTSTILQRECTPTTVKKRGRPRKYAISASAEQDSKKHPTPITNTIVQKRLTPLFVNKRGRTRKYAATESVSKVPTTSNNFFTMADLPLVPETDNGTNGIYPPLRYSVKQYWLNEMERQRRKELSSLYAMLKSQVPCIANDNYAPRQRILDRATDYISVLKNLDIRQVDEIQSLIKQNQRLNKIKLELG